MRTCPRAGCDGRVADDGFCDRCGLEARVPYATTPTPVPGGSARTGPPGAAGSPAAAGPQVVAGPQAAPRSPAASGPRAGSSVSVATVPPTRSRSAGTAAAQPDFDSGPGTAPWSATTSSAGRSRRASTRSTGRGRLGAGLVEIPRVPYRDPKTAVLADPEVPEAKRFCSCCGKEVGRSREGRPGRVEGFCPHCGHHFSFTPKLEPGEVLHEQYEVLGCLAHGGLGWIYLAADHAVSDRWVVLKGLLDSGDADAMTAAMAERRFLAEVEHPNIVKIHNFVRHADRRTGELVDYIVMEYVGGTSVKDMIKGMRAAGTGTESLPVPQAIAYALEVLPALGYLHGVGLLYCDFKPDNVIQTEEQLKLIDLGAVRRIGDRHSPIYGTIGYQAPEIGTVGPSIASDLYTVGRALAVMSFHFDFRRSHKESLPSPQEQPLLRRHDSFRRFLARATHRDPEQRFATAEDMAEQLTGVLREVLAQQDEVPRPGLSRQFTSERRAFGTETPPDACAVATGLPVPQVDANDPAAGFLATATTGDPGQLVTALRSAPVTTVEVRLQVVRALIEADRVAEAVAELDELESPSLFADDPESPAPDDWRPGWYRALAALVDGDAAAARERFERVCDVLPGEAAPKLATAVAAELSGDRDAARESYRTVWRTDHAYVSAAFGLARVLLAAGDRDAAVRALHSVPHTSSHHVAAQVAAVRAQAGGGLEDVVAAGMRLSGLELDVQRRVALTAELLRTALESLPCNGSAPPEGKLLDCEVSEVGLRLGLERCYRQLARLADSAEERIALVDRANAVRPRTLV